MFREVPGAAKVMSVLVPFEADCDYSQNIFSKKSVYGVVTLSSNDLKVRSAQSHDQSPTRLCDICDPLGKSS